jgi:TonB family protein
MRGWAVWAAMVCVLAIASAARAEDIDITGFGPFSFGMSSEAARNAMRDAEWRSMNIPPNREVLTAPPGVMVAGMALAPILNFTDDRLDSMTLELNQQIDRSENCTRLHRRIVTAIEPGVGVLSGAAAPNEYGRPADARKTGRGSEMRYYAFDDVGERWGYSNRRGRGFVEVSSRFKRYSRDPSILVCKIEISLDSAPLVEFPAQAPITPQQLAAATFIIDEPVWIERPTARDFEYNVSGVAIEHQIGGAVGLDCLVVEQGRLNCLVAQETPPGWWWGPAALNLSRYYRIADEIDGRATRGARVHLPVEVGAGDPSHAAPPPSSAADAAELARLVAEAPSAQELAQAEELVGPEWMELPSGANFAKYYPRAALQAGQEGRAVLNCLVREDGSLRCAIEQEEPEGAGFGPAALGISQSFRVAPAIDGHPTSGKRVRVPVSFRLG